MTLEETLSTLLERHLKPLVEANERLTREVNQLRSMLPTQLVSAAVAAKHLNLSEATVRRRIKDGTIPARRVGKMVRIDLAAVQRPPDALKVADLARAIAD